MPISLYEVDVNSDGVFDASWPHDEDFGGVLVWNQPLLQLLGDPVDDDLYPAILRVTTTGGGLVQYPFEIDIGNTPPAVYVDDPATLAIGEVWTLGVGLVDPGVDTVTLMTIDWGDGASESINTVVTSFSHAYSQEGIFTIRVTVTDEDGDWASDTYAIVGDPLPDPDPSQTPQILQANATIDEETLLAELTITASGGNGGPIVEYAWDLDGDGEFEVLSGPSIILSPTPGDAYPYFADVRVTNAAGESEYGRMAFCAEGEVAVGATLQNYREKFLDETPALKGMANYEIHHSLQAGRLGVDGEISDVFAQRILKETGINVHDSKHLRGIHKDAHAEMTAWQKRWCKKVRDANGWTQEQAYKNVNLDDYFKFAKELDDEFKPFMVNAGAELEEIVKVTKRVNQEGGRWSFVAGKARRGIKFGFVALGAFSIFTLFSENAQAAVAIAHHDANAMAAWQQFNDDYEAAIDQVLNQNPGRVTRDAGIRLRDSFVAYAKAIKLNGDTVDKIGLAMETWINGRLEP